jgi:protein-disulfide isomerase
MNRTTWIIIAVLCVLGLGTLIVITKQDATNVDNIDATKIIESTDSTIGDHVYGKADSKVLVVEYGDFQCSGCIAAHPTVAKVESLYKGTTAFVFRNYPIPNLHPNALAAASVAEAAGLQNKYWEMNNLLYNKSSEWISLSADARDSKFNELAESLSLDMTKFNEDRSSKMVNDKISTDKALGNKQGVSSTPSFFLNGEKVSNDIVSNLMNGDGTKMMDAIDSTLKEAGITPPAR